MAIADSSMTDDQLRHEEVRRAAQAEVLLTDELLIDTLDGIEAEILSLWENCPVRDVAGREHLWLQYRTAKKFRGILKSTLETGKMAKMQLDRPIMDKVRGLL